MIHDSLANANTYRTIHPRFAAAFDYLAAFDPGTPDGRVAIDGDHLFALVQSYTPKPAADISFESHRTYIDIQYMAAGTEIIQYSPLDRLKVTTPFPADTDVQRYDGPDDWPLFMRPREFAVLYPQDGHKPGCLWGSPSPVRKIVIKVRLET